MQFSNRIWHGTEGAAETTATTRTTSSPSVCRRAEVNSGASGHLELSPDSTKPAAGYLG